MTELTPKKLISIVVPVYNEEANLDALFIRLKNTTSILNYNFEFIFVDDGSADNSFAGLKALAETDGRIKALSFSRNFGKECATSAGCHHAAGDCAITMDADLQHPPELIPELIKKWEDGFDVVFTVRKENLEIPWFKRFSSDMYYRLINEVGDVRFEPHSTDFRLMDRKVLDVFNELTEKMRFFRGMIDWIGFKRIKIEFTAPPRLNGAPSYSYQKLFGLAINSITSFSLLPLRISGYLGITVTLFSLMLLAVMSYLKFFVDASSVTPLAFFVVINTFLVGIILCSLGFIALYIANINREVTGRPLYIIAEKININSEKRI